MNLDNEMLTQLQYELDSTRSDLASAQNTISQLQIQLQQEAHNAERNISSFEGELCSLFFKYLNLKYIFFLYF